MKASSRGVGSIVRLALAALLGGMLLSGPFPVEAQEVTGTVYFSGTVSFADPNIPIDPEDLTVSVKPEVGGSGPGVKCDLLSSTSDNPDPDGTYPGSAGEVSAELDMKSSASKPGLCIVTVVARGSDGVSVTARGTATVLVDPDQIAGGDLLTDVDIEVTETKALAGLELDCLKWLKKQQKKRAKCNFLILKKGGEVAAPRCRDACRKKDPGPPPCEPDGCDPGDYTEAVLAFSHGENDQQSLPDPNSGDGVSDYDVFGDQVKCQKHFGFAAANYLKKRNLLVQKYCINKLADTEGCRAQQSQDAKSKLDRITKCEADQVWDPNSDLWIPDVQSPCSACIDGGGSIDTKCMRECFQSVLNEYSDLMLGDVPECGNGIVQSPETCDDGNLEDGDCCSSECRREPGTEESTSAGNCSDLEDNDCDGLTDAEDEDCL